MGKLQGVMQLMTLCVRPPAPRQRVFCDPHGTTQPRLWEAPEPWLRTFVRDHLRKDRKAMHSLMAADQAACTAVLRALSPSRLFIQVEMSCFVRRECLCSIAFVVDTFVGRLHAFQLPVCGLLCGRGGAT
jgi:hypothetical protein